MADRGVRDQSLQIHLDHRDERAVHDSDDGQHGNLRSKAARGCREQRQAETQHAVGAHLQQDAGEHDRTGRWGFGMRVRQPRMQREQRHLDGKREEERAKQQHFRAKRQCDCAARKQRLDLRDVEGRVSGGRCDSIQPQNRHQHQNRAEHRVQNEFQRGVNSPFVAPDADQEIHRDQHHFPEQEKQEQIERDEDADDAGFKHQQRDKEAFYALINRFPGRQDRNRRQQRGQQHQEQAEAVDAEVVMNRRLLDPFVKLFELIACGLGTEATQEQQGNCELGDRGDQRQAANPHVIVTAQQQ